MTFSADAKTRVVVVTASDSALHFCSGMARKAVMACGIVPVLLDFCRSRVPRSGPAATVITASSGIGSITAHITFVWCLLCLPERLSSLPSPRRSPQVERKESRNMLRTCPSEHSTCACSIQNENVTSRIGCGFGQTCRVLLNDFCLCLCACLFCIYTG